MRVLRIRQWMIVGLILFMALPGLSYAVVHVLDERVLHPDTQQQTEQQTKALTTALHEITSNYARWHNSEWQSSLRDQLGKLKLDAIISDSSGAEIFRVGHIGYWNHPNQQAIVVESGQQLGTVSLFTQVRYDSLAAISAVLSLVFAVLFVGWQMRRSVVKPLEAMGRTARRIAAGELDFELPKSRVSEIVEVREAFHAMGNGLRESIGRQAELEEERRFFIGAIAHDLRTPLFVLRGYLEGLERGLATSPEKMTKYIAIFRQKSDQLDRLVSDLFSYSKTDFLEQTFRRGQLEFGALMSRVVDGLQSRALATDVSVTLDGPDHRCMFEGDEHLLERALENVLDNALRHTPTGGAISVKWQEESDQIVFTVADTGPGVSAQDLPHLFDPLYRGETSRNRETGGTGLGLTIARRIVRAHGGDLKAANRTNGGAKFTGWITRTSTTAPGGKVASLLDKAGVDHS